MNVGSLNKRIYFKVLDENSDWEQKYKQVSKAWARVISVSTKDVLSGKAEVSFNTVCFEIRYKKNINTDMVIEFEGMTHQIKGIEDVGKLKIKQHIYCEVITNG